MGRPIVAPKFAARLKDARDRRSLTMGQVVARIHQLGPAFEGFTRAQLSRYEDGMIAAPDPVVLLKLAKLYCVEFEDLAQRLLEDRLSRAPADVPQGRLTARGRRASSG